jgi:hypothetical protein
LYTLSYTYWQFRQIIYVNLYLIVYEPKKEKETKKKIKEKLVERK